MITAPRMAGLRLVRGVETKGTDEAGAPAIAPTLDEITWREVRRRSAGRMRDRYRAFRAKSLAGVRLLSLMLEAIYLFCVRRNVPRKASWSLAPERMATAKVQHWAPEELLQTLVDAEIADRDAAGEAGRRRAAVPPVAKSLDEFKVIESSVPQATFDYPASLE